MTGKSVLTFEKCRYCGKRIALGRRVYRESEGTVIHVRCLDREWEALPEAEKRRRGRSAADLVLHPDLVVVGQFDSER